MAIIYSCSWVKGLGQFLKMVTVEDYLKCPKWVKRVGEAFHRVLDMDNKGYTTEEDFLRPINELAKVVTDRPELIAKAQEARLEFAKAMGVSGSVKVDQQKFLELAAAYAVLERGRLEKGETPYLEVSNSTMLDVVDRNQDGAITWDEYKIFMDAGNMGEESAKAAFALLDKDNSGKISRSEYMKDDIKFWFELDDPDVHGFLGERFE